MRGTEAIGGPQPSKGRAYIIQTKDFTNVEQSVPLRLCYGRVEIAGVQITPIFNFRSEQTTTKAGK